MKKEFKAESFIIRQFCDDCDMELVGGDLMLTSYPPKIPHTCPKCSKPYYFEERYPTIQCRQVNQQPKAKE